MYEIATAKWKKCKHVADSFYNNNVFLSPYTSYDFLNQLKQIPNIHQINNAFKCRMKTYLIKKDGKDIALLPIYVNRREKKIYLLGQFSSVAHLDFFYGDSFSYVDFTETLRLLGKLYSGYVFEFNLISQYSIINEYLSKYMDTIRKDICVRIDFKDYDSWYSGLSKSCKQNLRTSYNRMNKDNLKYSFICHVNEKPENKLIKDNIKLFSKRTLEHGHLSSRYYIPMYLLKKYEALTRALFNSPNSIFASLYIGDKLAATCNGVVANDGRAIITRLSIDLEHGRYSPGGILINEMIRIISEKYPFIISLDLSRGFEPYKYTYGGVEHYNYFYSIQLV